MRDNGDDQIRSKPPDMLIHHSQFDDLSTIPGTAVTPIQTPYKDLFFQAFRLVKVVQIGVPGILPHSPTNYAGIGVIGETTSGDPMMTLNYQNVDPNIKSFALSSFYYGCTVDTANGAVGVPQDCRVTFTGYSGNDNTISGSTQICSVSREYHPTTVTGPQQQAFSGAIAGCQGLTHGVYTFQPMGGNAATASALALVLDDIKYNITGCK